MAGEVKQQPSPELRVINPDGKAGDSVLVPAGLLEETVPVQILHRVILDRCINLRRGTQSAKGRSDVRGGGHKPWRQKGTGRARQGSTRAPHWRGGAVSSAPKPRSFAQNLNRRDRIRAFRAAFSLKLVAGMVTVVETLDLSESTTKRRAQWLRELDLNGKVLLIDVNPSDGLIRSTANLKDVTPVRADTVSAFDLLRSDRLAVSRVALGALQRGGASGSA